MLENNTYENDMELDDIIAEAVFEDCFMEDVMTLPQAIKEEYLDSSEAAILEAKRLINGKTRIRMNKLDDLERRTVLGSIQLAKKKNDPLFSKFTLYRAKEKLMKKKMVQKYGSRSQRIAKISQKKYLKRTPSLQKIKSAINK